MSIKVAPWNLEGRLTDYEKGRRGTPEHILEGIRDLDADILVLPEAYLDMPADGVDDELKRLRYEWHDTPYDDHDQGEYEGKTPYLRVLSRLAILDSKIVRFGNLRNLLALTVEDPETKRKLNILGTHLVDESEVDRCLQGEDMISFMRAISHARDIDEKNKEFIALGDFNAMWKVGRARLFGSRAARFAARHMPGAAMKDLAVRFTDMATGQVLRDLSEQTGLRDADPHHKPTTTFKMRDLPDWIPSVPTAKIDHILVSRGLEVDDFEVGRDGGSDHRSISATITLVD